MGQKRGCPILRLRGWGTRLPLSWYTSGAPARHNQKYDSRLGHLPRSSRYGENARPGELVAIQGVGGLGHLGIQFARRMGFQVAAIARGPEKESLAKKLGAHHYIDSNAQDPVAALQALGGARMILATAANNKAMSPLLGGLAPLGQLIVAGAGGDGPIEVNPVPLLFGMRTVAGTMTGSSIDAEDTLSFSSLQKIRAMIETVPLAKAAEAYGRMMRNEARFRIVLVTGQ